MKIGEPLIVNLACTGVIPTRKMNPYVPVEHDEIVEDVAKCMELGVQIVHLHARDSEERQIGDPEPYGRLIESIRKLPGGNDLIIGVTTSGRKDPDFESRARVLDLDGSAKPDMASLTLSSLNFVQAASINEPDIICKLAERMKERGIKPELEVFDLGMINYSYYLLRKGFLEEPLYFNILLGNIAGAQPDPAHFSSMINFLPAGSINTVAGLGQFQLGANGLGILFSDGVRVGLEDNIWYDQSRTKHADNCSLVSRVIEQGKLFDRTLLPRRELRDKLKLI
ncbi:MAG TPA: 3-keto-5-aminohexanoate cleavage protein [Flexistipes sinusarabici]|uniref:3-keto-5-aminohexanoate cleavage protein n=1 Tax=Flexistipes sinusarabici TaxID=2352 RepID=A0A3D5QDA2_FLESI|nr:3-keto-5-aminohexanoate cleavage protein [Flexistipes sinusarabici]